MHKRLSVRCGGATRRSQSCRTESSEDAASLARRAHDRFSEELGMGRAAKKERSSQQTTDLHRAIDDARELIYGACWKLIRAQDIIVDEQDTLYRLQVIVQMLRTYADQELTQIK